MHRLCFLLVVLFPALSPGTVAAQTFTRSRLTVGLENPWEIVYGPDDHLWVSEKSGKVVRVDPLAGTAETVYTAPDYFPGDNSEQAPCFLNIGANTFGLALHPDFGDPANAYVYYIYSYNSGTVEEPATLFKIVRLTWDATAETITESQDLVTELANGFDHFGGRMIAVRQNGNDYLYYSTGDTGANIPGCYAPGGNPNLTVQDPYTKVGKIHRINIDGTVPTDNPLPGNTFFTRGHRNPQGLAYNPGANVVYDIEHGHTSDDEVNVLEAGMNYGWKNVQGYHDGNYDGELEYVDSYVPHPDIPGDRLVEPLYSWGITPPDGGGFPSWPTVAPSDGIYYGSDGIPEWTNSLLVVTLKNGDSTFPQVARLKLSADGRSLAPTTGDEPNPASFFREDQLFNGRLRDIAVSPNGKTLYLITNNRDATDPIIVYTYQEPNAVTDRLPLGVSAVQAVPNPSTGRVTISATLRRAGPFRLTVTDAFGRPAAVLHDGPLPAGEHTFNWEGATGQADAGVYTYTLRFGEAAISGRLLLHH